MVCKVYVIGMGMGNPDTLTVAAKNALAASDLIVGSQRLLDELGAYGVCRVSCVVSREIAQVLRESNARVASVVMSGDIGFFSGATTLYGFLDGMDVETIPGISSLVYLCAKLHVTWQDAFVVSAHGRAYDIAGSVQCHAKTFVLLGGSDSAADMCAQLVERDLGYVRVAVGERLSYDDERIVCSTAAELIGHPFAKLSVMLVENDRPLRAVSAGPSLDDEAFVRGAVPMTKEEVRELAVCKLRIRPTDTVYDIGAGTGSVSVEAARAAYAGQVFAIEKNEDAWALIAQNKERFFLPNLRIVAGEAPDALAGLTPPDRVFIGGSAGRLTDIVRFVLSANPDVRLCIAAITLETLSVALACVQELQLEDVDICQVSVAKAREVGSYHLMQAHNSVYLICAGGAQLI